MKNAVVTAAADAARLIAENRLGVESLTIENKAADVTVGHPAVSIGVGENPGQVLSWGRFLGVEVVYIDRRSRDVVLRVEGIKDGIAWHVLGSYSKSLTPGARNRFPGIKVEWDRREINDSQTSRGRISLGQLEVLIGHLGA